MRLLQKAYAPARATPAKNGPLLQPRRNLRSEYKGASIDDSHSAFFGSPANLFGKKALTVNKNVGLIRNCKIQKGIREQQKR